MHRSPSPADARNGSIAADESTVCRVDGEYPHHKEDRNNRVSSDDEAVPAKTTTSTTQMSRPMASGTQRRRLSLPVTAAEKSLRVEQHRSARSSARSSAKSRGRERLRRANMDMGGGNKTRRSVSRGSAGARSETNDKRKGVERTLSGRITLAELQEQGQRVRAGKRAPLKRNKSKLIPSSLHTEKQKRIQSKLSEQTNLHDLLLQVSPKKKGRKKIALPRRSSLKNVHQPPPTPECAPDLESSVSWSSNDLVPPPPPPLQKSVRFATNNKQRIWHLVHPVEKEPACQKDVLWIGEDDLDQRQEKDLEIVSLVEDSSYSRALRTAHKQSKQSGAKVESLSSFSSRTMASSACHAARGLENEVLDGALQAFRKKHCRAVLAAQSLIRDKNDEEAATAGAFWLNDAERKLIRLQSLKLSKSSQWMAIQMAELDEFLATATP